MNKLRVLLADDHVLFRAGLRALLQSSPNIQVVAEANTGYEAIEMAKQHRPDVAVLDISMKELNGLAATAKIKAEVPSVKVVILSMHDLEDYIREAFQAGASAYLLKDSAEPELELALAAVARGETYLSPRVSKRMVDAFLQKPGTDAPAAAPLTPRQREILQLIAEGHSTKEVAFRLGVSIKTVEAHRAQMMDRLDIHDVPGLVRYAIRAGLVAPDR